MSSSSLPPNLERIGRELEAAWRPTRTRPHRLRVAALVGAAALGALVLALFVTLRLEERAPRLSPIEEARAALVLPASGVFHVRIEFREGSRPARINEIWQSPESYRATNTGQPEGGGRSDGTRELFDAAAATIYVYRDSSGPPPPPLAEAYTANIRRLLESPEARVLGTETIDGIECVRIELRSVPGRVTTFYADAESFRPVLERSVDTSGTSEFWFRVWEVLPDDASSQRLSDLRRMYPEARIVVGARAFAAAEARLRPVPVPSVEEGPPRPAPPPPSVRQPQGAPELVPPP